MQPSYCLTCSHWKRLDDPCVGVCKKLHEYRFQLEGEHCELYEFCEEREIKSPGYIPPPKKYVNRGRDIKIIEQNAEKIRVWHKNGKTFYWIAKSIGIPPKNSTSISRWLKKHEEVSG